MKFAMKMFLVLTALSSMCLAETINVYFGTTGKGSEGIYKAKLNTKSGKLSQPVLAAAVNNSNFLALHPDKTKMYSLAVLPEGAAVVGYKIDKKGGLSKFTHSLINDGWGSHITVHPSGKFLLTAQYSGGSTGFFPLNKNGELGKVVLHEHKNASKVNATRQETPHPHWTGFSPEGKFAFIPDLGTDNIHIYKVKTGFSGIQKHSLAKNIPGGGPRHMRFSVDGKRIYLLNELDFSVSTFEYDSKKGTAKRVAVTPALPKEVKEKETFNSAAEIVVHPNGKFVWSSNRGHDSISAYKVDKTGKLTFVEYEHIRGSWPRNINLDPSGKWLLAAGQFSNTVSVFKIDQDTGELIFHRKNLVSVPGPLCILFIQ